MKSKYRLGGLKFNYSFRRDFNASRAGLADSKMAEGVGFEPTEAFRLRLISSQVPSTSSATLPLAL
jgi:hypothetical protein